MKASKLKQLEQLAQSSELTKVEFKISAPKKPMSAKTKARIDAEASWMCRQLNNML